MDENIQDKNIDQSLQTKEQVTEQLDATVFSIAGFWRRFIAFTVDGIIVSVPLLIIASVFKDWGYALGPYGRLVGYSLITIYWTVYHSKRHNGQTPGKKLLKIAVVDENGKLLSLRQSFFRAAILAVISLFNGWAVPILENPVVAFFATIVVFGGGISLFYGLVFNRTTRQGIHDLIMRTYVVRQSSSPVDAAPPKLPKIHQSITYGIIGLSVLIAIVGLVFQFTTFNNDSGQNSGNVSANLDEMRQLQSILVQQDDVLTAGVTEVTRTSFSTGSTLHDLNIEVWVKPSCEKNRSYCDELLKEIAEIALSEYAGISALDGMKISIVNRVDFGVATSNRVQGSELRIEDWQAFINE